MVVSNVDLAGERIKQFYIAMTNRCNLSCVMCTTTRHRHELEQELSLEQWKKVIANLISYNVESIGFGGGEPLLRRDDLAVLTAMVAAKGITVNIITNSTLLDKSFLERIKDYKDKIIFLFSLDGIEQDNDAIRGAGVFNKFKKASNLLREYGWRFFITSVLMPQNFARYVEFLRLVMEEYPEALLDIQPVIPHNEIYYIRNRFELKDEQLRQLSGIIGYIKENQSRLKLCRPVKVIERYWDYFTNSLVSNNQCKMGTRSFNVNLRGNLWICGKELEYPLYKYSLEDIFATPEYINEMKRVERCNSPCLAGLVI